MTYGEQLKDPRWQRRRLEILQRDEFMCRMCADTARTLHVHHHVYERGRPPWEADADDLVTLCEPCHDFVTLRLGELRALASRLDASAIEALIGFAKALHVEAVGGHIDLNVFQLVGAKRAIDELPGGHAMFDDPSRLRAFDVLPAWKRRVPRKLAAMGTDE